MSSEDSSSSTECIICFGNYDNVFKLPKVLCCGHTFCLECLARINVTSEEPRIISCPVCREPTRLPGGKGLPALENNQDALSHLPSPLQHVQSVRFSRNKGLLYVKKPQPISILKETPISTVSQSLEIGRPEPRIPQHAAINHRILLTSWWFYAGVIGILLLVLAIILASIFVFVISPSYNGGRQHSSQNSVTEVNSSHSP
ncbi:RING finger protein 225 [Protopterus annectens]|uniref:RING finger protein 225 n=1 Tax=Protopterus annectens TaxID=7888 RepID=UPI001CFBFF40|nr:RING finger protein 225 [Protopterus annectens]